MNPEQPSNERRRTDTQAWKQAKIEISSIISFNLDSDGYMELTTAFELDEVDIDESAAMDFRSYCRISMEDNHQIARYYQMKAINGSICTRNRNFNCWRSKRDGYSNMQCTEGVEYLQWLGSHGQLTPWRSTNQLGFSYRGWDSKRPTVRS